MHSGRGLHHARAWYHPRSFGRSLFLRRRLLVAVVAALASVPLLQGIPLLNVRLAVMWNVGALVYLAAGARLMLTCGPDLIRRRAAREDESRFVFLGIVLLAVASSFVAVTGLIGDARAASGLMKSAMLALAGTTILASWLVMQMVFAVHYAHEFYRPTETDANVAGGMTFPGDDKPDYWDFLYFTVSIGAASQTSDVSISSKHVRRIVLLQAILSFVFNTTVVALAINLAAGLV